MADTTDSSPEFPSGFTFGGQPTEEEAAYPVNGATEEGAEPQGAFEEQNAATTDAVMNEEGQETTEWKEPEGTSDPAAEGAAADGDDGMYGLAGLEGEPSTTVRVANLPASLQPVHFRLLFRFVKGVEKCLVAQTPEGPLVGFARFLTLEDAQAAIEALDGQQADEELPGQLQVSLAPRQLGDHPQPALKRPHDPSWECSPAKAGGKGWGGDWSGGGGGAAMGWGAATGAGAGWDGWGAAGGGWGADWSGGYGGGDWGMMGGGGWGMGLGMGGDWGMMGGWGGAMGGWGKGAGKGAPRERDPGTVYVGGIPVDWDESRLREMFSPSGTITRVNVKQTGNPQGNIAFVHFTTPDEASSAISTLDRYPLGNGAYLTVRR